MWIRDKRKNRNKVIVFIYLLIYKSMLEIVYINNISPTYSYSGLTLNINKLGLMFSVLCLSLMLLFIPNNKNRVSYYLNIIMQVFVIIPILSYYWLNNMDIKYVIWITLCSIIVSTCIKIKPAYFKIKSEYAKWILDFIFVFYMLISITLIVKRGGIDLRTLNFDNIYSLRAENQIYGIMGYFLNWCTKVFCPIFIVYYSYTKNKIKRNLTIIIQLLFYLSFGNKAFLLSLGLIGMITYIVKKNIFEKGFLLGLSLLNLLAHLLDIFNFTDVLRTSIPYRMVFIPAQIQFQYYDFFKDKQKLNFIETSIGKIFSKESPYEEGISYFISKYYSLNGSYGNANTGVFSDAYANVGVLGMIAFAIILGIIFYIIDCTSKQIPLYMVVGVFSYIIIGLMDLPLLTNLLTGGIGLMVVLIMVLNSAIKEESSKQYTKSKYIKNRYLLN